MVNNLSCIQDVVNSDLCISCGACASVVPEGTIKMRYSSKFHRDIPFINDKNISGSGKEFYVCPGKGYNIVEMGSFYSDKNLSYDIDLGFIDKHWAIHSRNKRILENASSGGIITSISHFLLSTKKVQGIVCTKFIYSNKGPKPISFIACSIEEL